MGGGASLIRPELPLSGSAQNLDMGSEMGQGKALRAIGQSLELFRPKAFEISKDGAHYVVRVEQRSHEGAEFAMDQNSASTKFALAYQKHIGSPLAGVMRYSPMNILWIDAYGRKQRKPRSFTSRVKGSNLSDMLRALGERLDRAEATAVYINWSSDSVLIDMDRGGQRERNEFRLDELQQYGIGMRFRRSRQRSQLTAAQR